MNNSNQNQKQPTIVMKTISELKTYENNPRDNTPAVDAVASSIKEFGFLNPIIIDRDNVIVAGHTRRLAALKLGLNEVPCIIADELTDEQIKAFRLADNKTAELATWDMDKLKSELSNIEMDLSKFGFEDLELDMSKEIQDDNFDADEPLPENPYAQNGDIFILGNHRLMCGDSTDENDVDKLMNQNEADLLLTDPPYNVNIENTQGMTIDNDDMPSEDFKPFIDSAIKNASRVMKKGAPFYIWYGDSEAVNFRNACVDNGLSLRQTLIWVKNGPTLGRQDYQWAHETCLYGWKEGASHYFVDNRCQSTVVEDEPDYKKMSKAELIVYLKELKDKGVPTTVIHESKPLINTHHPTMKPLKLLARQIRNSSKRNEIVLDLFGGSGSTLIACEQLERKCYMMELDVKYVDVIVARYLKYAQSYENCYLIRNGEKIDLSTIDCYRLDTYTGV